ncbi:MAG: PEGA domain-containing protein [candidate division WOR-3 bacterium]|nr:PEGA domain-containing protein [candidate division WOR-3 bacterium]
MATGRHSLGLTKYRYPGWDSTVMVTEGQTTTASAMLKSPPDSLWITHANSRANYVPSWTGPERAVRFSARSGFGYPLHITKVSAVFYLYTGNPFLKPWPDSSFRFKIYGGDGQTLLYQSPVLEAAPGEPGPAVVHELSTPVLVDSGEFYVAVAPIDASGAPSSLTRGYVDWRATQADSNKRTYWGSPGHWSPPESGELCLAVMVGRYGSIQANSTPSSATILLDSTNTGKTTPFLLPNVAARAHDLRLTKDGYADWHSSVIVAQGRTTTVDAVMSQSYGSLQVSSAPSGAAISLDGTNTGKTTPYLLSDVLAGERRLGLTKEGYPDWDSTVTVIDGQTTTIVDKFKAPPESVWATYSKFIDINRPICLGPERAVRFNPRDFGFGYPVHVRKVRAAFYGEYWPDSSFRFKIYGNDGQTVLYQSPVLEALHGRPGRSVVHDLSAPIQLDSGEFCLAVAPIDTSGEPASHGVGRSPQERKVDGIPRPDTRASHGHSYVGSPGRWSPSPNDAEFSCAVLLAD